VNRSKAEARLSAYLEGDLSGTERSQLESDLAGDADLRESLREIESVVALLRDLPEPELPPAFSTRVMAQVQEQAARPRGLRVWLERLLAPRVTVPLAAGVTALALVISAEPYTMDRIGDLEATGVASTEAAIPAGPLAPARPVTPSRVDLASAEVVEREMTLTEIQRQTLQTILSRHPDEDLARLLRGSLHPHASSFATHLTEPDAGLQVVNFERRGGRRAAR